MVLSPSVLTTGPNQGAATPQAHHHLSEADHGTVTWLSRLFHSRWDSTAALSLLSILTS